MLHLQMIHCFPDNTGPSMYSPVKDRSSGVPDAHCILHSLTLLHKQNREIRTALKNAAGAFKVRDTQTGATGNSWDTATTESTCDLRPALEDQWSQACRAICAAHCSGRAHNCAAHGAGPLAREPCADAGVTEKMAAC